MAAVDDDNWDNDFIATAISPRALQLPNLHVKPQDNFAGLFSGDRLKEFAFTGGANGNGSRNVSATYDDDFDGGEQLLTIKAAARRHDEIDPQEQTIRPLPRKSSRTEEHMRGHARGKSSVSRIGVGTGAGAGTSSSAAGAAKPKSPTKSHFGAKFELPARPDMLFREQSVEDYSDLVLDNDNVFINRPVHNLMLNVRASTSAALSAGQPLTVAQGDSPRLFHPSDLTSLPRSMQSPVSGSARRQLPPRPSVIPDRPMRRTRSSIEIQKFAEVEGDEDFSDIFEADKEESDRGSEDGGLMLMSKLSSNSWLGDEEEEDDPFAAMDPGWDEMDLEANIARDRHARLAEKVEELVRSLKTTEGEDRLSELSESLVGRSGAGACPSTSFVMLTGNHSLAFCGTATMRRT